VDGKESPVSRPDLKSFGEKHQNAGHKKRNEGAGGNASKRGDRDLDQRHGRRDLSHSFVQNHGSIGACQKLSRENRLRDNQSQMNRDSRAKCAHGT